MPLSIPSLGTLASIAAILSFGGLLYNRKLSTMDSKRERENYLMKKIKGRGWRESLVVFEVDDITIEERSGWIYLLKRWALRPLEGSVVLQLKSQFVLQEGVWESELMDILNENIDTKVEYIDTSTGGKYPVVLLRVDSVELEDMMPVVVSLTKILEIWMDGDGIELTPVDA